MKKADRNNIVLELNDKNRDGNSLFFMATEYNNIEIVKLFINYANNNKIQLNINEENNENIYPLLNAISRNNAEMVRILMKYADDNNFFLNINEQNNKKMYYPMDRATFKNNIEIVQLLIDCVKKNKITFKSIVDNKISYKYNTRNIIKNIKLNINNKNSNGCYPLLYAIDKNNNIEMVRLLLDYAKDMNMKLILNENDFKKIEIVEDEIFELLFQYEKENIINIEYKDMNKSYLLEKKEINNNINI